MTSSVLKKLVSRFRNDQRGNVALTFALAAVPLIGLSGAAVDYSRASTLRSKMAAASDAAALAAAKANSATPAERLRLARSVFDQNMQGNASMSGINFRLIDQANGVRVEVSAKNKNAILGIIGKYESDVAVFSEVARGDGFVEVALVLDNTYSMVNDFPGMKRAATAFTNTLFSSGAASDSLRMAVVPYIASVNVGPNFNMAHMDTTADSPNHGRMLKGQWLTQMKSCNPNPNPQPPSGGGGGGGGTWTPDPPDTGGGDGAWLQDATRKLAAIGRELFGINAAHALGETPNTSGTLTGTMYTPGPPYVTDGTTALVPDGFSTSYYCYLVNPTKINHFDLFARIPGARWGGCVEARPEPFDVTDDPPTADPRTKFVPYFWADEIGNRNGGGGYTSPVNNYMDDGSVPQGWISFAQNSGEFGRAFSILKYNGVNQATMNDDLGPNKSCPEPLLRLNSDRAQVLNKINAMRPIKGGGTLNSEGVAWGWRTLSPKAPFADGKDYGKAKKFLVLMSDGRNEIGKGETYFKSHYTAYGYLNEGRIGDYRFDKAEQYLDARFKLVCENAKKAGVTVMTVYFRDNNSSAKQLMRDCATNGQFFYEAVNESELTRAFTQIAAEIGKLRITK